MDIVACHRLGETGRIIVKLINMKDAQISQKKSASWEVSIFMMITPIPKEKSSLTKAFAHTLGNFMAWWRIWIMKVW